MNDDVFKQISSSELFDKISDITRIVDPLRKQVIEYKSGAVAAEEIHCFDFWGKNKACDNCISMRAFNENETYVKIEYTKDKTFMITAVPYFFDDGRVIVEIMKDITKSILFDIGGNPAIEEAGIHALIDNMNKLAFRDSLTNLYNRRYIMEKLPVDLLNAALSSTKLSIILADIDYFKKINDRYGHIAGDRTLKFVAETFSSCVKRANDWVSRYGGEEFLICMPGAPLEVGQKAAESMRHALESSVIKFEGQEFGVTASFGLYCLKSAEYEIAEDVIKYADEKLYMAKKNGRNRIEC